MYTYLQESKLTLRLAFPLILGQIGQLLMHLVDAIMVGRLGVTPLAAGGFGSNLVNIPLIIGFGVCSAVHILVSQSHGRKQPRKAFSVLKHGIWVTLAYSALWAVIIFPILPLLHGLGQPEAVVITARTYIILLVWSIVPTLFFQCLRNFFEAQNRPWIPFIIFLVGFLLNFVLNWLWIYGKLGFPALGLEGAGLATLVSRMLMGVFLLTIFIREYPVIKSSRLSTVDLIYTHPVLKCEMGK